jgi:hypothetical protein
MSRSSETCDSMKTVFPGEKGGSRSDYGRNDSDDDYADLPDVADTESESEDELADTESDSKDELGEPTDESDEDDKGVDDDDDDDDDDEKCKSLDDGSNDENEDGPEEEDELSLANKRPLRQRHSPQRLGMFCAMKTKIVVAGMPTTGDALKSNDVENWMRAVQEELKSCS